MTGGVAADVEAVAVERVFREAYGQVVATLTEKDRRFLTQQIEELAEDGGAASVAWRAHGRSEPYSDPARCACRWRKPSLSISHDQHPPTRQPKPKGPRAAPGGGIAGQAGTGDAD